MSQANTGGVKSTIGGWIKAAVTSVIGLISGAFIMYLTPVVNSAIKPAKPVANFATQATGLNVNFNNRSTGAVQGWWDFGDGSALEPFDPKQENVKHAYAKPGTYSVKLTLTNLIGEESDRAAPVTVEPDNSSTAGGVAIDLFELVPLDKRERAPAVYKLVSKVKNASYCILSYGDDRPTEVFDAVGSQERYITFNEMGSYTVRLAAVNGKQLVERTKTLFINPNDGAEPMAKLLVTYEAVRVERVTKQWRINCGWQADARAGVSPFRKEWPADPGCTIASVDLVNKDEKSASVRNVKWEVSADKRRVVLTGELVRPTGLLAPKTAPPHWVANLKVVMERRSGPQFYNRGDVMMAVNMNSTIMLPMQPLGEGYEVVRKHISVQLWDGAHKAWESSKAVTSAKVMLNNQACFVTSSPQQDGVVLRIDAPVGPIRPVGFERVPKLPKKSK